MTSRALPSCTPPLMERSFNSAWAAMAAGEARESNASMTVAAERRQKVAHSVSRGEQCGTKKAPAGAIEREARTTAAILSPLRGFEPNCAGTHGSCPGEQGGTKQDPP